MAYTESRMLGRGLHFAHQNARSLCNKFDTVRTQLMEDKYSILTISETWLTPKHNTTMVSVPGYTLLRKDREVCHPRGNLKKGGGVAMYINSNLIIDSAELEIFNKSDKDIEILWVTLKHPFQRDIVVASLYRPPSGDVSTFLEFMNETLRDIMKPGKDVEIFLLGDVNINLLDKDTETRNLLDLCAQFGLIQLIKEPTRWGKKNSLLDVIITNSYKIKVSGTIQWGIGDHEMVYVTRKMCKRDKKKKQIIGRKYKNYSKLRYTKRLIDVDWGFIDGPSDVGNKWDRIVHEMEVALQEDCPMAVFTVREHQDPWISNEILEIISNKYKLGKLAKQGGEKDKDNYRVASRLCVTAIRNAKGHYIRRAHHLFGDDSKKFWENIQHLIPGKKTREQIKIYQTLGGVVTKLGDAVVAQDLNVFFTNIGKKLGEKFTNEWQSLGEGTSTKIEDMRMTISTIKNLCREINTAKPSGIENISSMIVRDTFVTIPQIVAKLFNQAIALNDFPIAWKRAVVVPIHKGGRKSDYGNYRPISILPLPGKLLERCYHRHISNYLEVNCLLSDNQFGFRRGRSTIAAVGKLTNRILLGINENKLTYVSYIDLTKAFDTVCHKILLQKLSHLGIDGNIGKCMENYLLNRYQVTKIGENLSPPLEVKCGVPQGSVLGPLMFLIYINDINDYMDKDSIELFADDAAITTSGKNESATQTLHQNKLDGLTEWCQINRLTINVQKTKTMVFATKAKLKDLEEKQFRINMEKVDCVDKFKYLGITLDQTLSYNKHIDKTIAMISHKIWELGAIRKYSTVKMSLTVYKSTIMPYFDYGDVIYMGGQKSKLEKLQRLQNRALRICMLKPHRFNTDHLHRAGRVPKLESRRAAHLHNFAYSLAEKPINLKRQSRTTRSSGAPVLNTYLVKCAAYSRSSYHMAAIAWNNLPPKSRQIKTYIEFKHHERAKLRQSLQSKN